MDANNPVIILLVSSFITQITPFMNKRSPATVKGKKIFTNERINDRILFHFH